MMSGWGAKFFDFDNDGLRDLFVANGHPDDVIDKINPGVTYSEPLLLFQNTPTSPRNISSESGPLFTRQLSAPGLAIGDFDNDGAVDVLVAVNDGPPVLLRNNAARQNHWLGLTLIGKKSNSDAIGARISFQAGDLKPTRFKVGGGSYLSSHDPRIVLGLAKHEKLDSLEIKWPQPSGQVQRFTDLPINRYITITEGEPRCAKRSGWGGFRFAPIDRWPVILVIRIVRHWPDSSQHSRGEQRKFCESKNAIEDAAWLANPARISKPLPVSPLLRPSSQRQINHSLQRRPVRPSRRLHRHSMRNCHNVPRQVPGIGPSRQVPLKFRASESLAQCRLSRGPPRNKLFPYWIGLFSASERPLHHQASLRIARARKQVRRSHQQALGHGPRRGLLQCLSREVGHSLRVPVQGLPKQRFLIPKRRINARPIDAHRRRQIR
jgi:hypothetical protein